MGIVPRRLALALVSTAALVGLAVAAIYVTTAPAVISLTLEPFSLLLLPGLVASIVLAGPHDFSPSLVIYVSFAFYLALIYAGLTLWSRRTRLGPRQSR
jgi:hypothetical protein